MGTTAQKLEYLGTTKSQLKDMINYGLDEDNKITSSTTFRNYVSSIFNAFLEALRNPDTLFTNLPKKSGTGANITLNDTANAPMRIELGASELSQDGTPTPSSPQDIHTISGSNTIKAEGKNLANINTTSTSLGGVPFTIENGIIKINGTTSSGNNNMYGNVFQTNSGSAIFWLEVTGYTDSSTNNSSIILQVSSTGTDNWTTLQEISLRSTNLKQFSVTLDNTKYYRIRWFATANTFTNATIKIQLEYGATKTSFEPYTLQEADIDLDTIEYCKIGAYADEFIRSNDGTWQLKKNIGKVVLDENSSINYVSDYNCFFISVSNKDQTSTNVKRVMSNYFNGDYTTLSASQWTNYPDNSIGSRSGTPMIGIKATQFTNATELQTWLSTHNTIVYYVLATPTYTQITGTLAEQLENVYKNMLSQKGQTNTSQVNNDLSFELSVSAIEEL